MATQLPIRRLAVAALTLAVLATLSGSAFAQDAGDDPPLPTVTPAAGLPVETPRPDPLAPAQGDDAPAATPSATPTAAPVETPPATPTPTPTPPPSPERALLQRLHDAYLTVRTAAADFRQRRVSDIFLEELNLEGELFVAKPGRLRLDYTGDDDSQTLYVGDKAYLYSPALKQVDVVSLAGRANPIDRLNLQLLGFEFELEDVFSVYSTSLVGSEVLEDGSTSSTLLLVPLRPQESPLRYARLSVLDTATSLAAEAAATPESTSPASDALSTTEGSAPLDAAADGDPADESVTPPSGDVAPAATPAASATATPSVSRRASLAIRPVHLFYEETTGDTNEMWIDSVRINVDLDESLFVPSYPNDVSIVSQ